MKKIVVLLLRKNDLPLYLLNALALLDNKKAEIILLTRLKNLSTELPKEKIPYYLIILSHFGMIGRLFINKYLKKKYLQETILLLSSDYYFTSSKTISSWVYYSERSSKSIKKISNQIQKNSGKDKKFMAISPLLFVEEDYLMKIDIPFSNTLKKKYLESELNAAHKYSVEHSYFFCFVDEYTFVEDVFFVLRAFSRFKKRTKSNIKIVLFCKKENYEKKLRLNSYLFANDVKVFEGMRLEDGLSLIKNAYAGIYVTNNQQHINISELALASRQNCAMLCVKTIWTRSLMGENVIYFERESIGSLFNGMMQVFSDESSLKNYKAKILQRYALDEKSISYKIEKHLEYP